MKATVWIGGMRAPAFAPLAVGLAHFAVACGSLALTRWSNGLASVWLPNAILLAYLIASPRGRWPLAGLAVMISGTVANYLGGVPLLLALLFGGTNLLEPLVVALLLRAGSQTVDFARLQDLLKFVASSFLVTAATATLSSAAMAQLLAADFGDAWISWFASSFLGLLIATPICLIGIRELRTPNLTPSNFLDGAAVFGLVALASLVVFSQQRWPLFFVLQPPILIATFRLRALGAAGATLIIAAIGTAALVLGEGPAAIIAGPVFGRQMALLQVFLVLSIVTALPVAALLDERDRFARHLAEGEARFRSVVDAVSDVIFRTDNKGRWTYLNPSWEALTGSSVEETIGEPVLAWVVEEDQEALVERLRGLTSGLFDSVRHQFRFRTADGSSRWAEVQARRLEDLNGEMIGAAGIIVDISDRLALAALADDARVRAENEAQAALLLAATDELTGVASRRAFLALMDRELTAGTELAVVLFDVDHFKRVNDRFGHAAGDEVLRRVAGLASASVREGDLVGRLGGEEFAILMPRASIEQAAAVAERLRNACAETTHPPGLTVTISLGVASARAASTAASLLSEADTALYRAKFEGRNCLRMVA
jgi:diguanylate cyclase (GGDEF)-like protein/PAS domain S-box-containing protein